MVENSHHIPLYHLLPQLIILPQRQPNQGYFRVSENNLFISVLVYFLSFSNGVQLHEDKYFMWFPLVVPAHGGHQLSVKMNGPIKLISTPNPPTPSPHKSLLVFYFPFLFFYHPTLLSSQRSRSLPHPPHLIGNQILLCPPGESCYWHTHSTKWQSFLCFSIFSPFCEFPVSTDRAFLSSCP